MEDRTLTIVYGRTVYPCHFPGSPAADEHTVDRDRHSLLVLDGVVAGIADSDLELEAHDGVAGALAAALATDSLPALPAVMLPEGRRERGR